MNWCAKYFNWDFTIDSHRSSEIERSSKLIKATYKKAYQREITQKLRIIWAPHGIEEWVKKGRFKKKERA